MTLSPATDVMEFGVSGRTAEPPTRADGVPGVCVTVLDAAIYQICQEVVQLQRRSFLQSSFMHSLGKFFRGYDDGRWEHGPRAAMLLRWRTAVIAKTSTEQPASWQDPRSREILGVGCKPPMCDICWVSILTNGFISLDMRQERRATAGVPGEFGVALRSM